MPTLRVHYKPADYSYGSSAPMQKESEAQDDSGSTCAWCERPVEVDGATCDIECYSMLYGWAVRNSILGAVDFDGMQVPLVLEEQPWYEELVR